MAIEKPALLFATVVGVLVAISASVSGQDPTPGETCGVEIISDRAAGSCPPVKPEVRCVMCRDSCTSDFECQQPKERCCFQPTCGNSCQDRVLDDY